MMKPLEWQKYVISDNTTDAEGSVWQEHDTVKQAIMDKVHSLFTRKLHLTLTLTLNPKP